MKGIIRISTLAALSAAAITVSTSSLATVSLPSGWYVEGNVGESKSTNKSYGAGTSTSPNGWAGNVDIGYKFMPYFGGEIGYSRYSNVGIKDASGTSIAKNRLYSIDAAAKAILPVTDSGFEVFGKIGLARMYSTIQLTNSTQAANDGLSFNTSQTTATGLYLGLGADYSFMPNFAVVAQWARARGNSNTGNADLYTIGLNWLIG